MGHPKGLLPLKARTWLEIQIEAVGPEQAQAIVVLGFDAHRYDSLITRLSHQYGPWLSFINNPAPHRGSFSSLQVGLHSLDNQADQGALIQPIDVPMASTQLRAQLTRNPLQIAIPCLDNQRGHPVYLPSWFCQYLLRIPADNSQARLDWQIGAQADIRLVPTKEQEILFNLNTPQQWQSYCNRMNLGRSIIGERRPSR